MQKVTSTLSIIIITIIIIIIIITIIIIIIIIVIKTHMKITQVSPSAKKTIQLFQ